MFIPGPNMPIVVPDPEPEEKLSPLEQERMKEQVWVINKI